MTKTIVIALMLSIFLLRTTVEDLLDLVIPLNIRVFVGIFLLIWVMWKINGDIKRLFR